jgi:hypothetical protein
MFQAQEPRPTNNKVASSATYGKKCKWELPTKVNHSKGYEVGNDDDNGRDYGENCEGSLAEKEDRNGEDLLIYGLFYHAVISSHYTA